MKFFEAILLKLEMLHEKEFIPKDNYFRLEKQDIPIENLKQKLQELRINSVNKLL